MRVNNKLIEWMQLLFLMVLRPEIFFFIESRCFLFKSLIIKLTIIPKFEYLIYRISNKL